MKHMRANVCPECGAAMIGRCVPCDDWHARVKGWYAGDPDDDLDAVFATFRGDDE